MAIAIQLGKACNLSLTDVIIPSVPSDPTNKFVRFIPADDLQARQCLPAVSMMSPFATTISRPSTFSFIVPYLTAFVPEADADDMPPSNGLATGKHGP